MYKVFSDDLCIYDDESSDKSLRLVNPTLELSDNGAGSFKMTVPITNVGYYQIRRMMSDIIVYKDDEEFWAGRVFDESIDFWKNRTLTCEGELAFFNDTTQPQAEYVNMSAREFLRSIVEIHNSKVSPERQFTVRNVTVIDPDYATAIYTNYEKTIEVINKQLIERLGGHMMVHKSNNVRYLDYLKDTNAVNTQVIEFGSNLLDYTASYDMNDFATVIIPLGEKLSKNDDYPDLEAYLTVKDVNDGSIYVQNEAAVDTYGWIEQVVHFDEVKSAEELLRQAKEYLSSVQFDSMILEVKAVDLHYLNPDIEGLSINDKIRVISNPHGLDKIFPVSKLSIPLDHPENTQISLGTKVKATLTSISNKANEDLAKQISSMPTKQSILEEAKGNTTTELQTLGLLSSLDNDTADIPDEDIGTFTPWTTFVNDDTMGAEAFNFRTENGWIVSTNNEVYNSYSFGTLNFHFSEETKILLRCECKGTKSVSGQMLTDHGVISVLDHEFHHSMNRENGSQDLQYLKYSFYNKPYGTSVDLIYTVPSGSHFITFKFLRESATSDPNGNLKLRAFTVKEAISDAVSKVSLLSPGILLTTANLRLDGVSSIESLFSLGNMVINGANLQPGSVGASKLDLTELRFERLYLGVGIYLWYDADTSHLKININGVDSIVV